MVMVMNDLLPPTLCNVNQPSYSEIQLFQNFTMKIHGQGHVWSKVKVTFDLQNSKVKVMVKVKPIGHIWGPGSIDMFAFHFVAIGPFLAEI